MLRKAVVLTAFLGTTTLLGVTGAHAAGANGTWLTEDGKAQVSIAACGQALCGTVAALREPIDPETGRPKTDKHNSDAAKRGRPIVGIEILLGMRPTDTAGKWEGKIYNAEDGKTYDGALTLTGATTLKVEGCVLAGLICKAQTWTRLK
jgi:uncharacterized protein (DUF2147 family)